MCASWLWYSEGLILCAVRPWWVVELMITKWVGTERGTYGPFLHPPRCHRACDFHRTRRPPARIFTLVSFCRHRLYSQPYHSPGSYFEAPRTLWPFALYAAFPRADYYGHADC